MARLVSRRSFSHFGASCAFGWPAPTVTSHSAVRYGRPPESSCWSTRRTARPPPIKGAVSNQVLGPAWKSLMITNSPVSAVPFASNHWAEIEAPPPSVMIKQRVFSSQPSPKMVPCDWRSCRHCRERSWVNIHTCRLFATSVVQPNVPATRRPPAGTSFVTVLPHRVALLRTYLPSWFQDSRFRYELAERPES